MPRENRPSAGLLFWIVFIALVAQLPSSYIFYRVLEIHNNISHYDDIWASGVADNTDIEFVARLKEEARLNQDVQIIVGPYRKLFGSNFKYRLEQHLVFVEQSQTIKETFLILIDKTFYGELNREKRRGVLAHEMWHIFNLAKGLIKPRIDEEKDADNYALKYVSADTMLELCKQYEGDDFMREMRIENLERQRLTPGSPSTG